VAQRELVERAAHGDRSAYEQLARDASGRLYRVAYRIVRDADVAQDVMQQTLIQIWRQLPTLRDPDRFEAWTYRLVIRAATDEVRRDRRRVTPIRLLRLDAEDGPAGMPAMGDDTGAVMDRDALDRAFLDLTADQRAAVVLRFYVGLTLDEIAHTLEVPAGTAASRLHYGIRLLRAALESADRLPGTEVHSA
jgi:RNA polymerase sigma-70 factor (ECF subfamily)